MYVRILLHLDDSNNNGIVIGAVVAIVAAVVIVIITILIVVLVVRRSRSNSERVFESVEEPENEEHREDRCVQLFAIFHMHCCV